MKASFPQLPAFEEHRALIFGIAYRMLGSVSEAEDMVQETFLRWQRQEVEQIQSPKAWLTAAVTRLCIDSLRSARKRREEYVGVWLPEPLVAAATVPEANTPGLADSLSTAFLVLLETLSPAERASFLLREVFEYDYAEIGRIMEKNEASCRQMVRRAREHVSLRQPRYVANAAQGEALLQQFLRACQDGDTDGLLALLRDDAVIYSDGGGKVSAAPRPIVGSKAVARFLIGVSKLARDSRKLRFATINAAAGVLIFEDDRLLQTMTVEVTDGRVGAIYVVRNPDKLRHLS